MIRRFLGFLVVSFFVFHAAAPAFAVEDDGVIGTIVEIEGTASITPEGDQPAAAAIDNTLHLNDTIQTSPSSRVFVLFIDNTELTLSENTQVKIDNYVFDPDNNSQNKAAYSVMRGAFQYVSGLIGKRDNPDVHIATPVGSIGIRGTDFWAGNLDNQYNVAVNEGQVALKTDAGEEVVNKGQGTYVHDRRSRPAHAQAWGRDRFERVNATVRLKRHNLVRQRIRRMQIRQRVLRRRYKQYMVHHHNPQQRRAETQRFHRQENQLQNQERHTEMRGRQERRTEMRTRQQRREALQKRRAQQQNDRRKENDGKNKDKKDN